MNSNKIRQRFLDFFGERSHRVQDSAPLLPSDPELLFNIAGMVPFKPYFLGDDDPPSTRITTSQKCLRTEDIEQVGRTARHLTFFEMLGNFSFGDYFKAEAIQWAWEFMTNELGLNPDHMWVTVFGGDAGEDLKADHEARELWMEIDGLSEKRILDLGTEENFWAMGKTGPCGPCSEILYDQAHGTLSPESALDLIQRGEDRLLELWNLVFMEFNRTEAGTLNPLPTKNIDTGLGLERLASVLQDKPSNFETDLFQPLIRQTREIANLPPVKDGEYVERSEGRLLEFPKHNITGDRALRDQQATRIVADHVRASSFLLAENLLPGNEGRGYVLRRLIRRAMRWAHTNLDLTDPFLHKLVPTTVEIMGQHYKELREQEDTIRENLIDEEERFLKTLDKGMDEFYTRVEKLRDTADGAGKMSGEEIFDLYKTYGFPVEMTTELLAERNIDFEADEIESARKQHQEQSKAGTSSEDEQGFDFADVPDTEFTGYDEIERETEIVALYTGSDRVKVENLSPHNIEEDIHFVVLDKTPFYAEGGGQSGDSGVIGAGWQVIRTFESEGKYVHMIESYGSPDEAVELKVGQTVHVEVDAYFRLGNMRHHTATHLLHYALRDELGDQVIQDGSSLDSEHLRFDFTYDEAVDADTLETIERKINRWIEAGIPVETEVMDKEQAEEIGALAFFGEHYGQTVRVVMIENESNKLSIESKEFCGGTHVDNTAEIGSFLITNETAVASGVRRIEAKAGINDYKYLTEQRSILNDSLTSAGIQNSEDLPRRIDDLQSKIDELEDDLERLRQKESANRAESLSRDPESIAGVSVVAEVIEDLDSDVLKTMVDEIRQRLDEGVVLLASRAENNVKLVLGVTENLTDSIHAGDWIRELGNIVGGGGGGRPDFAEAGGSEPESVQEAISEFKTMLHDCVGEIARN